METVRSGPSVPPVLSFQGRYFVNVEIVRRGLNRMQCLRPGLEPTTHPQAGRPPSMAGVKLFAVIILKLVPAEGIEPSQER